jgi:hypothetical protein
VEPVATWFRLSVRHRLARGDTGLTSIDTRSITAGEALEFILAEFPQHAILVDHDLQTDLSTVMIDWAAVPASLRNPRIPAHRR